MQDNISPEEKALYALSERILKKNVIITAVWSVICLSLWILSIILFPFQMLISISVFFLIVLFLPLRLLKIDKVLLDSTYRATVTDIDYITESNTVLVISFRTIRDNSDIVKAKITCKRDDGKTEVLIFEERKIMENDIYYKPGDTILKFKGLKFPVKLPIDKSRKMICPKCGSWVYPDIGECGYCRSYWNKI